MSFDRTIGVVSVVLTAIAVSDRAEELWKRFKKYQADKIAAMEARDEAWLAREEGEFQRKWLEIVPDLR